MAALRTRAGPCCYAACAAQRLAVPLALIMGTTGVGWWRDRGRHVDHGDWLLPAGVALYARGAARGQQGRLRGGVHAPEEAMLTALTCGPWFGYGLVLLVAATVVVHRVRCPPIRGDRSPGLWLRLARRPVDLPRHVRRAPVFFGATVLSTLFWRLDLVALMLRNRYRCGTLCGGVALRELCQKCRRRS
jgi:hypothetical protein